MMMTYIDSRFLSWSNPHRPIAEFFQCDTGMVNVSELKRQLAINPFPITDRVITDLSYEPGSTILRLSTGATGPIEPSRLPYSDFRVPMILAYVPCEI